MSISLKELSERINGSGVPIGTVVAFRGSNIPSGWLLCDGRSCAGTELQKQLGLSNVPDLRGRFIRMVGGNAAGLGGIQEDQIGSHSHGYDKGNYIYYNADYYQANRMWNIGFVSAQTSTFGGNETRPVNMAMNFIIKANYS